MNQIVFWKSTYYIALFLAICCFLQIIFQAYKDHMKIHTSKHEMPTMNEFDNYMSQQEALQKETQILNSKTEKINRRLHEKI